MKRRIASRSALWLGASHLAQRSGERCARSASRPDCWRPRRTEESRSKPKAGDAPVSHRSMAHWPVKMPRSLCLRYVVQGLQRISAQADGTGPDRQTTARRTALAFALAALHLLSNGPDRKMEIKCRLEWMPFTVAYFLKRKTVTLSKFHSRTSAVKERSCWPIPFRRTIQGHRRRRKTLQTTIIPSEDQFCISTYYPHPVRCMFSLSPRVKTGSGMKDSVVNLSQE